MLVVSGYGLLPRSNHSVPDSRLDGGPSLLASNDEGSFCVDSIPLLETVSEDHEVHSRQRNAGNNYQALIEYYSQKSRWLKMCIINSADLPRICNFHFKLFSV